MIKDKKHRTLVINPGSTSTKIALFEGRKAIFSESIQHNSSEISGFKNIIEQYDMRYNNIVDALNKSDIPAESVDSIMARGGLLKPIEGGVWKINQLMVDELISAKRGQHASNLGAILAYDIGKKNGIPCYIADPVVVDEMIEITKLTGIPSIKRKSIFHALNQKYSAHLIAEKMGKKYEELNFIVAHMGGGITIGAHEKGNVIDVNNGLEGDGPFTPERCGSITAVDILNLCFSGKYSEWEVRKLIQGKGGLSAYFGTPDLKKIMENISKPEVKIVIDSMAYQIGKNMCAYAAPLKGKIDALILTGGLAYSEYFTDKIREFIEFLGPVFILPGENEMDALNERSLELVGGEIEAREYC